MTWRRSTPPPSPLPPGGQRGPVAGFCAALIGLCALLSIVPPRHPGALVVLAALAIGGRGAYAVPRWGRTWPYASAVLTAAAAALTGGARSPLLPYLLAPGLSIGLVAGRVQVVVVSGAAAGALLATAGLTGHLEDAVFVTAGAQWVLLCLALGLLAVWVRQLPAVPDGNRYAEARGLLRQLHRVTRRLPGGLDATAAADGLLDRCQEVVASARSVVLVQAEGEALIPLAVRGAPRVPWRTPLDEAGPLRECWTSGRPVVDVRAADDAGRRRGSTLAVIPFQADGTAFGLVILESFDLDAFPATVLASLLEVAEGASLQLETAMLFEEVRSIVTLEERDRLARDMHDGVAQELAFVGYQLDDLRARAAQVDAGLAGRVAELRTDVTRIISDIRLSITDLRTSVGSDRGLGTVLTSSLRALCAGRDLALHLSLQESAFRLPGNQEVLVLRCVQAFTQPLRRRTDVRNLWVQVQVDPPSASVSIEHDGVGEPLQLTDLEEAAARVGGTLRTSRTTGGGLRLELVLRGRDPSPVDVPNALATGRDPLA